jgi:hypothetical protein
MQGLYEWRTKDLDWWSDNVGDTQVCPYAIRFLVCPAYSYIF